MGSSLEEYAARNPQQAPAPVQAESGAGEYRQRQREAQDAEQTKAYMLRQLEQGTAPEIVLFYALHTIGTLTHDAAFTERMQEILTRIYSNLEQQTMLTDAEAEAQERLQEMRRAHNDKLRRQLERELAAQRRIENALQAALREIPGEDPEPEE